MSSRRGGYKTKSGTTNNKYNDAANKKIPVHQAPPNHPQENFPEHRTFLARSLNRNDAELAALVDLNRSLHEVRANIIKVCGEETLLDLGEGLLVLTPCGRDLMVAPALAEDKFDNEEAYNTYQQSRTELQARFASLREDHSLLCVDFLSRMKLRRRLLNRLARRLMRVAHAMDGEDVSPPLPPKYGDLKLNVDVEALENAKRGWKYQEEARQRVTEYRRENPSSLIPLVDVEDEADEEVIKDEDKMDLEEQDDESNQDDEEESKATSDANDNEEEEESDQKNEPKDIEGDVSGSDESNSVDVDRSKRNQSVSTEEGGNELKEATDDKNSTKETSEHQQESDLEESGNDDSVSQAKMEANKESEASDDPTLEAKAEEANTVKDEPGGTEEKDVAESNEAKGKGGNDQVNNITPQDTSALPETDEDKIDDVSKMENTTANSETTKATAEDGNADNDNIVQAVASCETDENVAIGGTNLDVEMEEADKVKGGTSDQEGQMENEAVSSEVDMAPLGDVAAERLAPELRAPADDSNGENRQETPGEKSSEASEKSEVAKDYGSDTETNQTMTKTEWSEESQREPETPSKSVRGGSPLEQSTHEPEQEASDVEESAGDNAVNAKADGADSEVIKAKKEAEVMTGEDTQDKREEDTMSIDESAQPSLEIKKESETLTHADTGACLVNEQGAAAQPVGSGPEPDGTVSSPVKAKEHDNGTGNSEDNRRTVVQPRKPTLFELPPPRELSQLEKDFEILKDYVDAYEKQIDPLTGEISFRILNEKDREEDYVAINRGVGVGASSRNMSLNEKEVEFKRWQTSLLSRLPEAPTFDEIGIENCVFLLEERRKRLRMTREEEMHGNKKPRHSSPMKAGGDNDGEPKARNIGAVERKSPPKKSRDGEGKNSEEKVVTKRIKPIPLVPYPSFFESDLRRIRLVHFDLMATSIQSGAKNRLDAAQIDYNTAFKTSNQLFDRKQKLETQLNQIIASFRQRYEKMAADFELKVSMERKRWLQQKAEHDANRLKKLMPSKWNSQPVGTPITQTVCSKYKEFSVPHIVGTCVGDITDAVITKLTNPNLHDEPFESFSPPPLPDFNNVIVDQSTGETAGQQLRRLQNHYTQEIQAVTIKLNAAEEERKRLWKRLLKHKSEAEQAGRAPSFTGHQGGAGAYTPARRNPIESFAPAVGVNTHDHKYSASATSKALKDRVAADGSIEPPQKRKGADGLYQRPAGRGRKGMDWDPVRGVWIPQR